MNRYKWLVVKHYGCADEEVVGRYPTYEEAETAYFELFTDDERDALEVEVAYETPDGLEIA